MNMNLTICDHYTVSHNISPRRTMLYPLTSVQYTTTPTFTMHAIIHYFRNQFLGFHVPVEHNILLYHLHHDLLSIGMHVSC
ncbi:hypothetical protein ACJX0J_014794, partial [Zea mays]